MDYAMVDARGLANGHPEQTSEERHESSALDASIDPALQSCTASSVAGLHHFDVQSMSSHPQPLDSSAISVVHPQVPDPVAGMQGAAHYPESELVARHGNPQVKPPQSPWPDLPIRPPLLVVEVNVVSRKRGCASRFPPKKTAFSEAYKVTT